ncbi:MAG: Hsp20 family protein [Holophagaceae bacterium]
MTEYKLFNQIRPFSVGFDHLFTHFEHMLDTASAMSDSRLNFPPYNIVKTGDYTYDIEVALAGFSKNDIEVKVEENTLSVMSLGKNDDKNLLHRGISKRSFNRTFTIADDIVVKSAELKDGLLRVQLERVIPEEKKPRIIEINAKDYIEMDTK